ncbi:MAG: dihydrodipicolinate synthase family protein, partial [Bacteroidales bacterium]|nr:dihydrodipicolinate synthase family protein [Bacteroidales bacterium]
MRPLYLQGCGTALVTPFTQSGEVDYPAYINLVKRQVENGVDFLVPLATTGETPTLSAEEKQKIFALTKEHCGGLPLVAGLEKLVAYKAQYPELKVKFQMGGWGKNADGWSQMARDEAKRKA